MGKFVVSIYDNRDQEKIERYDGVLLLNKHGDLYLLLHNFGVQIIPFKRNTFKEKLSEGKKIWPVNVDVFPADVSLPRKIVSAKPRCKIFSVT